MLIRMEYIMKEFGLDITDSHITESAGLLAFKILDPATISELDGNVLYLCREDLLPEYEKELKRGKRHLFLFDVSRELPPYLSECNYLICTAPYEEIFSYVNRLGNIFLKYNGWEQELTHHLNGNSRLQDMLNTGYSLLQIPMAIVDVNHQVLAITDTSPDNDTLYFCMQNGYGYHFLNIINRSNPTLEEVAQQGVAEVINNISGHRLRVYRIYATPYTSYFIGFHKQDQEPFHPADIFLFDYFVGFLSRLAQFSSTNTDFGKHDISFLLEELILSENCSGEFINQTLAESKLSRRANWHLLSLRFTGYMKFRTTHHFEIIQQIQKLLPDCHCALIQSHIVILTSSRENIHTYAEKLRYIQLTNDAVCACSMPFSDLGDVRKVWLQLMFVLDSQPQSATPDILFYENYAQQHCISEIQSNVPEDMLLHSALRKVQTYDEKNSTDYLKTMVCYLQNNCSMNTVAELLQLHRNSLLYRVKKIEEILGYELSSSPERNHILFSTFFIS